MAEAVTYADLRFVKAPLRKSVSSQLGLEADDDGELTYENIQVPPGPGGPLSLDSSGLRDKAAGRCPSAGIKSEQPTASWSSVTPPAAGRILPCRAACLQYLLLGLLLSCLLLGVATICLGVRYLQASQQLQQVSSILEATNSSLRQQLHLTITQLGQREEALQGSRRELAQSQEAIQVEQKDHQAAKGQLQACQSDRDEAKEILRSEEVQRRDLEQRLNSMQDTLKRFFTCPSQDTCCPVGWILSQKSCFYFSLTQKNWEESQTYCRSLSSNLATVSENFQYSHFSSRLSELSSHVGSDDTYWIGLSYNKSWKWIDNTKYSRYSYQQVPASLRPNLWSTGPKIISPQESLTLGSAQPRADPCLTLLASLLPA